MSEAQPQHHPGADSRGWFTVLTVTLLTSMAAGMGWGIRGQYGHETGAMIAGTLASLTLVLFFVRRTSSLASARAAAMMTVAIGIGGTMTYGQTVGLTHDQDIVGNWDAFRWGMLGLFIKGGIWIGFGGLFLGMGLGGKRYRPMEMLVVLGILIGLVFLGIWLINSPFDPENKILPRIYFSDSWEFEPDKIDMKPRREVWGGLLMALVAMTAYAGIVRRDTLAVRMAFVGFIAGGLGFPGGQCVQASHAWNPELYTTGSLSFLSSCTKYFNWWNMMETTFGLIFGAVLALGLWLNRRLIRIDETPEDVTISPTGEVALCVSHLVLLMSSEFLALPKDTPLPGTSWLSSIGLDGFLSKCPNWGSLIENYTAYGLFMVVIPMVGILGGRFWPYLQLLPVVAAPILGKQIRGLCGTNPDQIPLPVGWFVFAMLPIAACLILATWQISRSSQDRMTSTKFAAITLLAATWLYMGLNTVFFNWAWPWDEWTGRTPNQLIFMTCTGFLTVAAVRKWQHDSTEK